MSLGKLLRGGTGEVLSRTSSATTTWPVGRGVSLELQELQELQEEAECWKVRTFFLEQTQKLVRESVSLPNNNTAL